MKTVRLNYQDVHQLEQVRKNMFWDGWTLVCVDPSRNGSMRKDGIFFNGKWCVQKRVDPDSTGLWRVPLSYV